MTDVDHPEPVDRVQPALGVDDASASVPMRQVPGNEVPVRLRTKAAMWRRSRRDAR
jgi:hypothetical protein